MLKMIRVWVTLFVVVVLVPVALSTVYHSTAKVSRVQTVMLFANHPGGANVMIPLIEPLRAVGYDVDLYGVEVALDQYRKRGYEGTDLSVYTKSSHDEVRDYLSVIDEINPTYVVTSADGEVREQYLWKAATISGIPSMAVLDWWPSDYSFRFSLHTPTKICVLGDSERHIVADQLGVDLDTVVATGSPHFDWVRSRADTLRHMRDELRAALLEQGEEFLITFISSPMYADQEQMRREFGYTEYEIVQAVVEELAAVLTDVDGNKRVLFSLRPHPRLMLWTQEKLHELSSVNSHVRCVLDTQPSSVHSIVASDLVCGIASTVLGEAVVCGAPVLSVQIGLLKSAVDPFIFSRRGATQAITRREHLYRVLRELIVSQRAPRVELGSLMCREAVPRIVAELQKLGQFVRR